MTERLTTLACALGALALFVVLFVQPERDLDRRRDSARPTTEETRGSGYRAAYAWLAAANLRTVSLRESFAALGARADLPRVGNVLMVTLPGTEGFQGAELRTLQAWIRSGNTLLLLAALSDAPDWATVMEGVSVGDLKVLTGMDFNTATAAAGSVRTAPILVPNRPHAYFEGMQRAWSAAARAPQQWTAHLPDESFMLALARDRDTGKALLWTRFSGEGRIVVSALGSLFTDNALGRADNAQLFANIIRAELAPAGAVIFDDFHQGLSAAYDPEKFYSDPRLYLTGLVLLALWLVWVLGATRLRVPVARIPAPREADAVRIHGAFLARVLTRDAAARRLIENLSRRVALRQPRGSSAGPWEYLATHISSSELAQLRHWHTQALAGGRVPLVRLYNLLRHIDRQIV